MANTLAANSNSGNNAFKVEFYALLGLSALLMLLQDKGKPTAVRNANIMAARGMLRSIAAEKALRNCSGRGCHTNS